MDEITPVRWLPVPEWEDLYEVSEWGHVWSIRKDRPMRPSYTNSGNYPLLILSRNGKQTGKYVHHLVLEAFVGPCPEGMEARHLDGNSYNPDLTNLCWGTSSENKFDEIHHGTHAEGSRTRCDNGHELTEDNVWTECYEDGTFKARRCKTCNRDRATKQREKRKTDERRCKEEGCGKPYFGKGWCSMHYGQWHRALPGIRERNAAASRRSYAKKVKGDGGNEDLSPR